MSLLAGLLCPKQKERILSFRSPPRLTQVRQPTQRQRLQADPLGPGQIVHAVPLLAGQTDRDADERAFTPRALARAAGVAGGRGCSTHHVFSHRHPEHPLHPHAHSARPRLATAPLQLHQRVGSSLDIAFAFEGLGIMR